MRIGELLHGRYECVRELGSGAAGALLLVRDQKHQGAQCALKYLQARAPDPELLPLFRNEFLLLSEISHKNIVSVREFGVSAGGEPYYTMDYAPGESCRVFAKED
ncbi:MAG: hypothetical protein OER88_09625, partial [Planctomycetota bacterium]|nr:hypothetical protein [Planctomycetota bacterium]